MRVLNVISSLNQGGMESVVVSYFNNMDENKVIYDFLVLWYDENNYWEEQLKEKGCRIFSVKHPPKDIFSHNKEIKAFFRKNKYDTVCIHAPSALRVNIAKIAKKNGVANVIYYSHSAFNCSRKLLHKICKPQINKWCDYRFACSFAAGEYMFNKDFKVINNAIDIRRFEFNDKFRKEMRDKYSISDKVAVIGYVARLVPSKNHSFLINVAKALQKKGFDYKMFFVGEGCSSELLKQIEQNNLDNKIVFCGAVGEQVNKYYNMFDIVAFPSKFEGLSMSLVEAQANGLPIIASNSISAEHKLSDNFEFLPIDNNDDNYAKWADEIFRLVNKRTEQIRLSEAGFDIVAEAKKLQKFFLDLQGNDNA